MVGGGKTMNDHIIDFHLPIEIDLLFDNKKLDVFLYLGILYHSKVHFRKRKITLEQLLYYYTVIYSQDKDLGVPLIYKYLRDKERLNENIVYLSNLGFVILDGDITTPTIKLKISITDFGIDTIVNWESDNVQLYIKDIYKVMENYPFENKSSSFKQLLYEGDF